MHIEKLLTIIAKMTAERIFVIPGVEAPLFRISHEQRGGRPKTALLFQEQYLPSPAIVDQLWKDHPEIVGDLYASANREFDYPISKANFDGPAEYRSPKKYLEVSKFVFSHACYLLAKDTKRISTVFVAGDGVAGRVNALVASQSISFEEGLKLLRLIIEMGINPSPLAREDFEKVLRKEIKIKKAKIPIVASSETKPINKPDEIRSDILASLTKPGNWQDTLDFLNRAEVFQTLEPGNPISKIAENKGKLAVVGVATAGTLVALATLWRRRRQPEEKK